MFDEPSSYLDVKQRLKAARGIRGLLSSQNYVIVVEHDLSVLDYLSDFICCLYGLPGAYGVVTMPFSVREGIILNWRSFHFYNNSWKVRNQMNRKKLIGLYFHLFDYILTCNIDSDGKKKNSFVNGRKSFVSPAMNCKLKHRLVLSLQRVNIFVNFF